MTSSDVASTSVAFGDAMSCLLVAYILLYVLNAGSKDGFEKRVLALS